MAVYHAKVKAIPRPVHRATITQTIFMLPQKVRIYLLPRKWVNIKTFVPSVFTLLGQGYIILNFIQVIPV